MDKRDSQLRFKNSIEQVLVTKYILSAQKISDLLRTIASDNNLFDVVGYCMQNFDYKTEYEKAFIQSESGDGFHLPYSKKRTVALVTCMLYDFDNGSKDFSGFLDRAFFGENTNDKYARFLKNVIKPYAEYFSELMGGEEKQDTVEVNVEPKVVPVPNGAAVQIEYILREINVRIAEDEVFSKTQKNDLLLLTDGMNRAVEMRDVRLIKGFLVGLRATLLNHKKIGRLINDVEACLKLYLVI